jgi:hypothetical protein
VIVVVCVCVCVYAGPVCAVCSDQYAYRQATSRCEPCSDSAGMDVSIIVVIVIAVVIIITFGVCYLLHPTTRQQIKTIDDLVLAVLVKCRLLSVPQLQKEGIDPVIYCRQLMRSFQIRVKIYVTLWQILSILPFALDLKFPDVYSSVLAALSVVNLDVTRSSLITCSTASSYDFIDGLVIETVYPICVVCLLYFASRVHIVWISCAAAPGQVLSDRAASVRSIYYKLFLIFTYLILPGVSSKIFQTFSCKNIDPDDVDTTNDDWYMTADYSVSCESDKYRFGCIWTICMIFIYPVGIPAYYFHVLYIHRALISGREDALTSGELGNDMDSGKENAASTELTLRPLLPLFDAYKPSLWWWEIVETVSRLLITGILILIVQGSAVQVITGCCFALAIVKMHDTAQPFLDPSLSAVKGLSLWQIFGVFFIAMLLKADFPSVDVIALDVVLVLVIFVNLLLDVCTVLWFVLVGRSRSRLAVDKAKAAERESVAHAMQLRAISTSATASPLQQQKENEKGLGDDVD